MAEYIDREALLHDIEQSVVYTARGKITSAEMRGAHKIIERIKCAPAVEPIYEPIYIHEPTESEFKRMAAQLGYVQVVRCKDCKQLQCCNFTQFLGVDGYCSYGEYKRNTEGIKWQTKR